MRLTKALSGCMGRDRICAAPEAVRISSHLIAFYPQPLREAQPYVILLDQATGILKRLDLEHAK